MTASPAGPVDVPEVRVRRAGDPDADTVAALRRAWIERRGGVAPGADPGFEHGFATWWRAELGHHAVWLAEARIGADWAAVGSLDVAEVAAMPAPGRPGERWGYVGSLVALPGAPRGVPRLLLTAAVVHAREHGLARLVLRPSAAGAAFYRAAGFAPAGDEMMVLATGGARAAAPAPGPGGTS